MLNISNKISFHRLRGLKDFDLWHEKNVWLGEYHDWSSSRRIDREKVGGQIGDRWDVRLDLFRQLKSKSSLFDGHQKSGCLTRIKSDLFDLQT